MHGAQVTAPAARRLARFAVTSDPPRAILDTAALHFLDLIGVALAAASLANRPRLEQAVAFLGGNNEATAFGSAMLTSAAAAALLNGSFAHALEADDTHIGAVMHGSCVVCPAALAAAERADADGRTLLRAVVAGWEALIRIGLAFPGDFLRYGFQATSVAGPFGAALACGLVRGLDEGQLTNALGIAGSQCSGLFEFLQTGATSKWLHGGWPALSGIAAVELAMAGLTGPDTILDGERGLGAAFLRRSDAGATLDAAMADLSEVWRISEVAVKLYPTCHFVQPFVECLTLLLKNVQRDQIRSITCHVADGMARLICEPWAQKLRPVTLYQAKWSLPYCLGAVLAHDRICVETFDRTELDEAALRWADRVSWIHMDAGFPRHFPARITLLLRDGTQLSNSVENVLGCPDRPIDTDTVLKKFVATTERALSPEGADLIIQDVMGLADGLPARRLGRDLRAALRVPAVRP